jgi:hypothetical protein
MAGDRGEQFSCTLSRNVRQTCKWHEVTEINADIARAQRTWVLMLLDPPAKGPIPPERVL